jgi:electron transfer flavoprotein alpha subunit
VSEVLVLAETTAAGVRKPSLELLTAARALGEPAAVVFGAADDAVVAQLGEYGATKVYTVDAPGAGEYLSLPKAEAVVQIAQASSPVAILATSSPEGKDVAARVAVRLDSGIITDAVSVALDGGAVVGTQSVFAGRWLARSQVVRGPAVVTMRPNATSAEPAPASAAVESVSVAVSEGAKGAKVTSREAKVSTGRPELTDAALVVAGGRGVGSQEGFAVIETTADALGAAVGASRTVTDQHWARVAGGPDRQDRRALALPRGRDLRGHPAPGGHAVLQDDRRGQQGRQGTALPDRRLRRRRGPAQGAAGARRRGRQAQGLTRGRGCAGGIPPAPPAVLSPLPPSTAAAKESP